MWETGASNPPSGSLKDIAEVLNCTVDELLEKEQTPPKEYSFILGRIRAACQEAGISIPRLEEEIGFGQGTICKWNRSTPTATNLKKVADYFGVDVDYFMADTPRNKSYERFSKLLEERGLTAYRVAKDTGILTATLSAWKAGQYAPKINKLQAIAGYFGVDVGYFLDDSESVSGTYGRFAELLRAKGISSYKVSQDTGIAQTTLSSWKNGAYDLKADKLLKLADYFGVDLNYFYGRNSQIAEPESKPAAEPQDFLQRIKKVINEKFGDDSNTTGGLAFIGLNTIICHAYCVDNIDKLSAGEEAEALDMANRILSEMAAKRARNIAKKG